MLLPSFRVFLLAIVLLKPLTPASASQPANTESSPTDSLGTAWLDAATFRINEANQAFAKAQADGARERERKLGEAVTHLNVQPRTERNLAKAGEILKQIISESDADEAGIFASYLLARWHEFYENPPKHDQARQLYLDLLKRHAGNPVAEASASSLVLLYLYENIPKQERATRFAELEKLANLLKTSSGRRDYHLNMGNAYIDFSESPSKAAAHLIAADAEGITRWQIESATWISIGELARVQGDTDLARRYYGRFLEKYRRDNRHHNIEKRLEALAER